MLNFINFLLTNIVLLFSAYCLINLDRIVIMHGSSSSIYIFQNLLDESSSDDDGRFNSAAD
jgi:hypothetical protein